MITLGPQDKSLQLEVLNLITSAESFFLGKLPYLQVLGNRTWTSLGVVVIIWLSVFQMSDPQCPGTVVYRVGRRGQLRSLHIFDCEKLYFCFWYLFGSRERFHLKKKPADQI